MRNSIAKIWVIILVLAATLGALIFWGASNYRNSAAAIQRIVQPEQETVLTNSLYKSVVQADLHFNNFILTRDSLQWRLAVRFSQITDSLVNALAELRSSASQPLPELDTLRAILNEKGHVNRILLELKERQVSQYFTEQALDRIKQQLSDSAYIDKAVIRKRDLVEFRDTLQHVDIVQSPEKQKGMSGFFRRLFGKERMRIDTVYTLEEQIDYGLQVSVDSSIVRNYFMDSTLAAVKNILIDVLDEEVLLQRKLFATELELITYNELLLRNIRAMLGEITEAGAVAQRARQELAIRGIEDTQRQAFIIAAAGILLGFGLLLLLIRDITRANYFRKNLELEKERAEQLAAAKEIFLSRMSHEIRTPLHSISGLANLLERESDEAGRRKLLNGINYANQYLSDLISNMLEQARINAGTFRLDKSRVYVPELCAEIEVLFRHRQEEQHNVFLTSFSKTLGDVEVLIDRIKLKQVLINLLGNAFKFTRNGTVSLRLDLQSEESGQALLIRVADTGEGIDPAHQAAIFRPFNQVTGMAQSNLSGTGLGLAISKHIVEHFGGELSVSSEKGKGSLFTLSVPVTCKPREVEVRAEPNERYSSVHLPVRVMVVEDDDWNAYLLCHFLSVHVHTLELFSNAEEALDAFAKAPEDYDLILTDLNMPRLDGKSFFIAVREHRDVPVIALSAGLSRQEYEQLKSMGFSEALGKPFSQADLLEAIRSVFPTVQHESELSEIVAQQAGVAGIAFPGGQSWENPLFMRFVDSVANKVPEFLHAASEGDHSRLATLAHQLKSNLEQIGLTSLSERLQTLELFVERGQYARALEEAVQLGPMLDEVVARLKRQLDESCA